jgi:cell division protein FtsB
MADVTMLHTLEQDLARTRQELLVVKEQREEKAAQIKDLQSEVAVCSSEQEQLQKKTEKLENQVAALQETQFVDEKPRDLYIVCEGARGFDFRPFHCAIRGVYDTYAKGKASFVKHSPQGRALHTSEREIPDAVDHIDTAGASVRELLYCHDLDDSYGGSQCTYLLRVRPTSQ